MTPTLGVGIGKRVNKAGQKPDCGVCPASSGLTGTVTPFSRLLVVSPLVLVPLLTYSGRD